MMWLYVHFITGMFFQEGRNRDGRRLHMVCTLGLRACVRIFDRYLGRGLYQPTDYTRGLYYRGVE